MTDRQMFKLVNANTVPSEGGSCGCGCGDEGKKERAEQAAAESRQRGTRKKQGGKSAGAAHNAKKGAPKPKSTAKGSSGRPKKGAGSPTGPSRPAGDFRPGRAHRAAVAAKRSGGKRRG